MKAKKLIAGLAGLGAAAMSICSVPVFAAQGDNVISTNAAIEIEEAINQEDPESGPATENAKNGGEAKNGDADSHKNDNQKPDTDWSLFGLIGGGAVVVLISIGVMAKKK